MVDLMSDLPDTVVGVEARGTVTAADYDSTIIPAVEALFARHGKARFLCHLGDRFEGIEAGAAWDDTKLGFKHLTGWEKMAVVTDIDWIRTAIRLFGLAIPGHVRVFHNSELAEAKRWVAG